MNFELPTWNPEQRKLFHRALADWVESAAEEDFDKLEALRERMAPGEVCSLVTLVRRCALDRQLLDELPQALVKRLRAANLLRPFFVAQGS